MVDKRLEVGEWEKKFDLKNVAIHVHLLPTGKVLYWGRREQPVNNMNYRSLNEHKTSPFILDVETCESIPTGHKPTNEDEMPVNLFCAGHTFLSDGRLIIFGGHVLDGFGEDQATIYDPFEDKFTALPPMSAGRWYPTAIALSDGSALVVSGSSQDVSNAVINLVPQTFNPERHEYGFVTIPQENIFSLYPRLFHAPQGKIFMAGPMKRSRWLDLTLNNGHGQWTDDKHSVIRPAKQREYAGSAMYDNGKVIWVSGGGGEMKRPTKVSAIIDLNQEKPHWEVIEEPKYGRRHHFCTTLPDGTVLVTAGTQGKGFNDLTGDNPVHAAELWNPDTGDWTTLAKEDDSRGYHHTALLLPDARVLSAGGGEWDPDNKHVPNAPEYTKITAQIFKPPYLFKGEQPIVSDAPATIEYEEEFKVTVDAKFEIKKVTLTRLGSVTHCHNHNQSFQQLTFEQHGSEVSIQGPQDRWMAPPGHYMLFLIDSKGVPSKAPIVLLKPDNVNAPFLSPLPAAKRTISAGLEETVGLTNEMRNLRVIEEEDRPPVSVGLTPACPYGLGACWGGAYEALASLDDVQKVRPIPDGANSVAFVYLSEDIVPDIDTWRKQLSDEDGGTYQIRGIGITLTGLVTKTDGQLVLAGTETRGDLVLNQFQTSSNLLWDNVAKTPRPVDPQDTLAYQTLYQKIDAYPEGLTAQVTGTVQKSATGEYSLDLKEFVEK